MKKTFAALATACALSAAGAAAAQEVAPAPAEHPTESPASSSSSSAIIVTGAVLFGAAYVPSYFAAVTDMLEQAQCLATHNGWAIFSCDHVADRLLWIPLAGPWVTLSSGQPPGGPWTGEQKALLVADGIAQDVGFAVLAYGVVRKVMAVHRPPPAEAPPAIVVQPGAAAAMAGLTVVGRF
jgi:hypothetical protein